MTMIGSWLNGTGLDPTFFVPNLCIGAVIGYLLGACCRFLLRGRPDARAQGYKLILYGYVPMAIFLALRQVEVYCEGMVLSSDHLLSFPYLLMFFGGLYVGLRPGPIQL